MYSILLLSGSLAAAGAVYLGRVRTLRRQANELLDGADPEIRSIVNGILHAAIAIGLPPKGGAKGLHDLEVQGREPQDTHRTLHDLLGAVARDSRARKFKDCLQLGKLLYQFQFTLGAPTSACYPLLAVLEQRLRESEGGSFGRLEAVSPGVAVDLKRHLSLNFGTYVENPLGVIVFNKENAVLHKAKVLCR